MAMAIAIPEGNKSGAIGIPDKGICIEYDIKFL